MHEQTRRRSHYTADHSAQRAVRPARYDVYPTRTSAAPARFGRMPWVDRPDPVVWSATGNVKGPFDSQRLRAHADQGYTLVPGLLSPAEVQQYWSELDRLTRDPVLIDDERVIREPASGAVRSIFEVHRISASIAALARDQRVLNGARQILGSDVYIHQSRINYMPGFTGNGFYWHSDFETWHAEDGLPSPRTVSLQIALTDNYAFNGGLMIIPGSHRHFVPGKGATPHNNYEQSLVDQQVGVPSHDDIAELSSKYGINQFTGAAGAGLWFDANLMHGSGNNITPYPRSNIFLVFNSVDNRTGAPYEAMTQRPAYISARNFTPLRP